MRASIRPRFACVSRGSVVMDVSLRDARRLLWRYGRLGRASRERCRAARIAEIPCGCGCRPSAEQPVIIRLAHLGRVPSLCLAPLRAISPSVGRGARQRRWDARSLSPLTLHPSLVPLQFLYRQFQIVGRHVPTEKDPQPQIYRMKMWARDDVKAKSKFWYFLRKLRRVKKANGQILAVNEIFEKNPTTIKNYGIWVRYNSRTGVHNAYKEYRDTTLNGAVMQMYQEMGSRHRARHSAISIIKTATIKPSECKRPNIQQFHDSKISFPLTRKVVRPTSRVHRTLYKASRPNAACF